MDSLVSGLCYLQHDVFELHHCYCVIWSFILFFFLLPNSIQLYEYNNCLFTTDRHLGCFWGLGIMNKAAMNIPLQGLCGQMLSFLLGKYPVMELLGRGEKNHMFQFMYFPNRFTLRTRVSENSTCSLIFGFASLSSCSHYSE